MRITTPIVVLASMFVAAGGSIHLREWLDTYRHVPAGAPGAALVRVGFPLNTAVSILLVVALALAFYRQSRLLLAATVIAFAFEAMSLTTLIATRTGSVLGWSESMWTLGADQSRAVEIAALVALAALAAMTRLRRATDGSTGTSRAAAATRR